MRQHPPLEQFQSTESMYGFMGQNHPAFKPARFQSVAACSGIFYSCAQTSGSHEYVCPPLATTPLMIPGIEANVTEHSAGQSPSRESLDLEFRQSG